MLKVKEYENGGVVEVSGDAEELMLFYCLFQSLLYPGWIDCIETMDVMKHEAVQAVRCITIEKYILFSTSDPLVVKAFEDSKRITGLIIGEAF